MSLRDFFTLPALIMFVLGVILSGMAKSLVGSATAKTGA